VTAPEPISKGRYALYEDPGGGAVLAWRPDGATEDCQQPIPPVIWQLMRRAAGGEAVNPAQAVKALLGSGKAGRR
jgi:hypothetical protein